MVHKLAPVCVFSSANERNRDFSPIDPYHAKAQDSERSIIGEKNELVAARNLEPFNFTSCAMCSSSFAPSLVR